MKTGLKSTLAVLVAVAGLGLAGTQTAHAARAGYLVKSSVTTGTFLQTKKTITTTNGYFKDVKVTIPKGTIFQQNGLYENAKTHRTSMTIDLNQLRWSSRQSVINSSHNQQSTAGIWAKTSWFKKVARPSYLKYYSVGNGYLWSGNKWPEQEVGARADGLRITSDGYLESFSQALVFGGDAVKPLDTAKVQKVLKKGTKYYVYTQSKVNGVPSTHVKTSGKYQYRVTINRTGRHLLTPTYDKKNADYFTTVTVSNRYYVGGNTYYMFSGNVFAD